MQVMLVMAQPGHGTGRAVNAVTTHDDLAMTVTASRP